MKDDRLVRYSHPQIEIADVFIALRKKGVPFALEKFGKTDIERVNEKYLADFSHGDGRTTLFFGRSPIRYAITYQSDAIEAKLGKNKSYARKKVAAAPFQTMDESLFAVMEEQYARVADARTLIQVMISLGVTAVALGLVFIFLDYPGVGMPISGAIVLGEAAYLTTRFNLWSISKPIDQEFFRSNCWTDADLRKFKQQLDFVKYCGKLEH